MTAVVLAFLYLGELLDMLRFYIRRLVGFYTSSLCSRYCDGIVSSHEVERDYRIAGSVSLSRSDSS